MANYEAAGKVNFAKALKKSHLKGDFGVHHDAIVVF